VHLLLGELFPVCGLLEHGQRVAMLAEQLAVHELPVLLLGLRVLLVRGRKEAAQARIL
jgi:hypothetical protein